MRARRPAIVAPAKSAERVLVDVAANSVAYTFIDHLGVNSPLRRCSAGRRRIKTNRVYEFHHASH